MLALETMSPTWTAVFYIAGLVCFLLAALSATIWTRVSLGWLGLFFVFLPPAWNALAAS